MSGRIRRQVLVPLQVRSGWESSCLLDTDPVPVHLARLFPAEEKFGTLHSVQNLDNTARIHVGAVEGVHVRPHLVRLAFEDTISLRERQQIRVLGPELYRHVLQLLGAPEAIPIYDSCWHYFLLFWCSELNQPSFSNSSSQSGSAGTAGEICTRSSSRSLSFPVHIPRLSQ